MLPIQAIAYTASLWAAASAAFYLFLPVLGVDVSYNASPVSIALFYLAWVGIAAITFRDLYREHVPSWREFYGDAVLSLIFGIGAGLFLWALSQLAEPGVPAIQHATDILRATPWYFLPKSIEILFQQLLIAALVLALGARFRFRTTVLLYAILFGSAHLLLLFGGQFPPTVLIMTLAAVTSSAFFPYLLLRVRRGFLYCYMIHWAFYAALILLLRLAA